MLERLRTVPAWALLSLAMNGLLFLAALYSLRDRQPPAPRSSSVLPQANASISDSGSANRTVAAAPSLGERQYLNYQQWVELLAQEAEAAKDAPRLTVLLGDSISLWFPPELLPGRRTWLNQAISGEQSEGLLQRLELLDEAQIETIFLMIGINDLIAGKPQDALVRNVEAAIAYLRDKHPDTRIVVQSILPHGAENATWEGRDRLLVLPNARIRQVNAALAQIAPDYDAEYLDLHSLFVNGNGDLRSELTTDGLHLNDRGYWVWRTAIALELDED